MGKQTENKAKRNRLLGKTIKRPSLNHTIQMKKIPKKSVSTKRPKIDVAIKNNTKLSTSSKCAMKQDQNCWKCREPNTELHCTKCALSYHSLCIHMMPEMLTKNWQCPSCHQIEEAKQYWTNRGLNRSLLSLVVKRLYYDSQFNILRNTTGIFPPSADILDLNGIHQKIKKKLYNVPEEILFDIKNIHHKCLVHLSENESQVSIADKLLAACIKEINDIKSCWECYMNRRKNNKQWMIYACERPHLLVWAKFQTYPYWPAKVLSYTDKLVAVEFFDDHTAAELEIGKCLLYSRKYPLDGNPPESISAAVTESRKYVKNIMIKFGAFEYASERVPLDVKRFDEQLRQMVPNWSADSVNKLKNSEKAKIRKKQKYNDCASAETNPARRAQPKMPR